MKTLHDIIAVINIAGSLYGMWIMLSLHTHLDTNDRSYKIINWMMFACVAFCFFSILREMYTIVDGNLLSYSAWVFKFASSGIFIITISVHRLIKKRFTK